MEGFLYGRRKGVGVAAYRSTGPLPSSRQPQIGTTIQILSTTSNPGREEREDADGAAGAVQAGRAGGEEGGQHGGGEGVPAPVQGVRQTHRVRQGGPPRRLQHAARAATANQGCVVRSLPLSGCMWNIKSS